MRETITLTNAGDLSAASRGLIPGPEARSLTVKARVDTGSRFLAFNEETRAALGLELDGTASVALADGSIGEYALTGPVEFRWKDRSQAMRALVIPGAGEVLFGALCMKALDLMADPVNGCLKGCHGDEALYKVKQLYPVRGAAEDPQGPERGGARTVFGVSVPPDRK